MKFSLSSKKRLQAVYFCIALCLVGLSVIGETLVQRNKVPPYQPNDTSNVQTTPASKAEDKVVVEAPQQPETVAVHETFKQWPEHTDITTTIFWVGEGSSKANGGISNKASAWDENWSKHFGGIDAQKNRNGYLPSGFTPEENTFYFALPYNDADSSGHRKTSATNCPEKDNLSQADYSWCKNSWIKVSCNDYMAYGQWEDVGPFLENDAEYVFGNAKPHNTQGEKAGLDISPALQTYLHASDTETCTWQFVDSRAVGPGPWLNKITTSLGEKID